MDRTQKIIKYLEEYEHVCYIKATQATNKAGEDYYRQKMKDIGNIIKELEGNRCWRTVDK